MRKTIIGTSLLSAMLANVISLSNQTFNGPSYPTQSNRKSHKANRRNKVKANRK